MEPFSDPDGWLFDPLPGHLPPHPLLQPHVHTQGLNGRVGELDRAPSGDVGDGQLDVLDDLFTLLIDSPPPATATTRDESAGGLALAPTLPSVPPPSAAMATNSPLSSSSQSEQEEDYAVPPPAGDATALDDNTKRLVKTEAAVEQPVRKKKRRKRPKDELDYLRGKVTELEQQLSALRTPESPPPARAKSDPNREDDAEWEEIALHQKHEAESARATNTQLRSMLEGQLSVAQQLQQALQQHLKMARIEGMDAASSSAPPPQYGDAHASPQLFEGLIANLDDLYNRVDTVLASAEFTVSADPERARASALKTNDHGAYFEIANSYRLPFPMAAMNRALWRSITLTDSNMKRGWVRRIDDNTLNFGFSELFGSRQLQRVTITVKASTRRYVEQSRTVNVWSSVIEIDGSMYVRLREDGWGVVTPSTPSAPASKKSASATTEVSLMQNVVHVMPEVANVAAVEEKNAHVGEMTDLVLSTYRHIVRKLNQTLENLLLADTLAGAT